MNDLISRQAAIDAIHCDITVIGRQNAELVAATIGEFVDRIKALPSAQPEDYTGLKRELIQMASYIDVILECSDDQKETMIGFISRLSQYMPWTERD